MENQKEANQEKIKEKAEEKHEKPAAKPNETKHEAVVRGINLPISTKHAIAICRFIQNKTINESIAELEKVLKLRKAIPFRGEIPHRHGKGIYAGRYPVNAAKQFIKLLKNLNANAAVNNLDPDSIKIKAKADIASRRRFSRRYSKFKRSNVLLVAKETIKNTKEKLKQK